MTTPLLLPQLAPADRLTDLIDGALAGEQVLVAVPEQPDGPLAALAAAVCQVPLPAGVVVFTSGSTGTPKAVHLASSALLGAARAHQERHGVLDWVSPLALHTVAGLMTLVRARVSGTTCRVVHPDLRELPDLARPERSAISLVPTQLHRALRDDQMAAALARFALVLLGGAAADPDLVRRARASGIPVVTTYGMSETAGGCVHDGRALPGVQVRIDAGEQRIWLGGPMLFSGYVDPERGLVGGPSEGWLATNDRGRLDPVDPEPGDVLQVLGRLDDVVISGGVNVDLAQVQGHVDRLAAHPACVLGVPDDEWGTRVVLVVDQDEPGDLTAWREHLAGSGLARTGLPRQLVRTAELPRTASGKVDRQRLRADLTAQDQSSTSSAAPTSNPIESSNSA